VVPLRVPPLRERGDDVRLLALSFLKRFNRAFNREPPVQGFTAAAETLLLAYAWPGNVRELENAVERAVLLTDEVQIGVEALPEKVWTAPSRPTAGGRPSLPSAAEDDLSLKRALALVEDRFIRAALRRTRGNRTRAAELLELSHRALLYKIKDYGIDPDAEGQKGPLDP
jgi:two-component system response regulator AtoC